MNEFLDIHYGKAAPPIRWFINLIHEKGEAIRDGGCSPPTPRSPEKLGMDERVREAGLKAFQEAMRLADNEAVRARVEKLSICAYALAITDAYDYAERLQWKLEKGPMGPDLARRTRPYARRLFELCKKHGVTHWAEKWPLEVVGGQLRPAYGLKEDETW